MRILVSWLRDFVPVTASAHEIAETLALRGFEVAAIEALDGGDAVIDFEVTANRPDCLSVLGFAREVGVAFDLPVRLPSAQPGSRIDLATVPTGASPHVEVTIADPDLCPRYAAAVADAKATTSPQWMLSRLQAAGVRPISPFVDITNYVLMELGHPMHAFDRDTLAGHSIVIRRAQAGERLTTLDGADRALEPQMLVIADESSAQAVAGVMGGAASEVTGATKTVVFESACFQPASVRRTSKRLGLKTEASSRFERGADVNAPVIALQRAIALMQHIGAGRVSGPIVDRYPSPRGSRAIALRRDRLARLLGLHVPDADVVRILSALGLSVLASNDGWSVEAPTFRVDLLREVDLIEEVGRHFGFDNLEPAFPVMTTASAPADPRIARDQQVRRVLTAAGLSEAVAFGFIESRAALAFLPDRPDDVVAVANPLSAKFDVLRPSLLPGLVDAVAHNRRHGRRDVALFEIGTRFTREGESRGVAMAWTGLAMPEHWSGGSREVDFFDLKGVVSRLCESLRVGTSWTPVLDAAMVAGQTAHVMAGDVVVGVAGRLAPSLAERAGAPQQDAIFVAELSLDRLATQAAAGAETVRPLPRHPFVVRDLSIVIADALPADVIRGTIHAASTASGAPLTGVKFFDRYRGKGVPEQSVSLSVRLTFQAPERTLTDGEVQDAFDHILSALVREHGAVQR